MKTYNFKAKTSNLKYPTLEDNIISCTDYDYNMVMISDTLVKLTSVKSVEEFNTLFGTSEDETISWADFNLEFMSDINGTPSLFIVNTNNVHSYNINNITGELEHV